MNLPAGWRPLSAADPAHVGPWRLLGRLGAGGMGVVYLAERANTRAALKVIHTGLSEDATFRTRFRREVETSRTVSGPYVAAVLDADADGDQPWLATEFVSGPTLGAYVDEYGSLDVEQATALAAGLLEGLTHIHAAGVVHRDLKPSNVLLTERGPVVIDFGIATALDATSLTGTGMSIGSAGWMAPEQVIGAPAGPAADVFSWGALTAFAAIGRAPFGVGRADALAYRIAHGEPDLTGLPAVLDRPVRAALAKDPSDRPTVRQLRVSFNGDDPSATATVAATWQAPTQLQAQVATHVQAAEQIHIDAKVRRSAPVGDQDPSAERNRRGVSGRRLALLAAAAAILAGAVGTYLAGGGTNSVLTSTGATTTTSTTTTAAPTTTAQPTAEPPTTAAPTTAAPTTSAPTTVTEAGSVALAGDTDLDESHWGPPEPGGDVALSERIFDTEWQYITDFPVTMNGCNTWQKRIRWRSLGAPLHSGISYYNPDPQQYPIDVYESGGPSMEGTMVLGGCEQPAFATDGDGLSDIVVDVNEHYPQA